MAKLLSVSQYVSKKTIISKNEKMSFATSSIYFTGPFNSPTIKFKEEPMTAVHVNVIVCFNFINGKKLKKCTDDIVMDFQKVVQNKLKDLRIQHKRLLLNYKDNVFGIFGINEIDLKVK